MNKPTRYREIILSGIHKMPQDKKVTLAEVKHHFYDRKTGLSPAHRVLRDAWASVRPDTHQAIIDGDVETFNGRVLTETLAKDGTHFVAVVDESPRIALDTLPTRLKDIATRMENVDRAARAAGAKADQQNDRNSKLTATALQTITRVGAAQVTGLRMLAEALQDSEE